jgi:uncharacterized membrane protein
VTVGLLKKSDRDRNLSAEGGRPARFARKSRSFADRAPSPDAFFNSPTVPNYSNYYSPRNCRRVLLGAALALFLAAEGYYGWLAVNQHLSHHTYPIDVGIIDDALSQTLHGHFMYSTIIGKSHFAVHFTPTLLLLLPVYAFFDSPVTLLLFQSIFLVAASVPIFLLTEKLTSNRLLALLMGVLYLFNYYVASVHLASHYEAILPFCLLMALYGAVVGRWRLYWVFVLLALGVKTDMALYIFFLGLYLCLVRREKRAGWATIALSILWFALGNVVVGLFAQGIDKPEYLRFWGCYGNSLGEIVWHLARHPWIPFQVLLTWRLAVIPATAGFLCLADWRSALLIVPPAMVILLSPQLQMQHFFYYRTSTILPFLFFSAILGLSRLQKLRGVRPWHLASGIGLLVALSAWYWATQETLTNDWRMRPFPITEHHRIGERFLAQNLPQEGVTAVQWDLYCQVPRGTMKILLSGYAMADWVVIDRKGWPGQMSDERKQEILNSVRANFVPVATEDGYVLARRKGLDNY